MSKRAAGTRSVFGRALPISVICVGLLLGAFGHLFTFVAARRDTHTACGGSMEPLTDAWVVGYPPQLHCEHDTLSYIGRDYTSQIEVLWLCTVAVIALGVVMYLYRGRPPP